MTPTDPTSVTLFVALAVFTLGYAATCWLWPFKACRTCRGAGKLRSPFLRAIRLCPACNATGLRPRVGRKAYNALLRVHRAHRRH
ncbi:hypothetical protein E1161_08360 [Saccharopolyspora aridisoli]|uniref:Uncharacterized protein n=1 Tax=Saccharopolyspora aridisoli TaxID=2530385 RepID=A0A4R4UU62_9PSEU|nr:hypothetical protein [Saccharopolyspora aridisoli]TDC94016.1 hypothetical protein E1161_08360 [Saccharopolyspora aridisoli]